MDSEADEPLDIAQAALANAQRLSRRGGSDGRRIRRENLAGRDRGRAEADSGERNRGGYSAPGPDPARDPHPLGEVLTGYVAERGWDVPLAEARVFSDWPALVGAEVAAHCTPVSLRDGELRIAAESTAWATQLRLLGGSLLARLVAEVGPELVRKLLITGPAAPSWKHGGFSVRGARGPRDTYG